MHLRDMQYANINAICREGGYYSVGQGILWNNQRCEGRVGLPHNNFHKFYYFLEGSCSIRMDGNTYTGVPGRLFYIPAGTPHSYSSNTKQPFAHYWVHFDLSPYDTNPFSVSNLPAFVDVPPDGQIPKLFETLTQLLTSRKLSSELQVKSVLFSLLAEYIRLATPESDSVYFKKDPKSERLLKYIQRNLDKDLSNGALAAHMHMSLRSFIRYFEEITGYTPAKYVMLVRMMTAKTLLEESDLSVSDIMYRIGIDDLSAFSKMFKKRYDFSPRVYREMYRKDE